MATANKCDRCGKLYESTEKSGYIRFHVYDLTQFGKYGKSGSLNDLCPTCTDRLAQAFHSDGDGELIGKLNEQNRRLRVVAREMFGSLKELPSSWEDGEHHVKHYKDTLRDLGVDL